MAKQSAYAIEYGIETKRHLGSLTARQQATVLDSVLDRLSHQPTVETRNRKRMRPNALAEWELRIGSLRVYHDVVEVPHRVVLVRAVGVKNRERVTFGGQQVGDEVLQDDEDAGRG